ncbi:LysR family transcriptional regulator [Vitreoscilla massiliensis]|uniref:LysR family transcriptional regulator n=1 Tax=Vitreoscilla massiliensis TaxID=1689272 RepID=A0ABY4E481_9NEIS|nr:LysR family transcriptional regulator [Vitreoscilla massiliensis]UOO90314.1 LysR family transcriptional regulator [Vitreoscilla massiliensis]
MIDDVRYLLVFAKIVATGSISAAAEALHLSAATVSSHLHKLERSVGTALLYRNTRKLSLTPDGAKLYATAQTWRSCMPMRCCRSNMGNSNTANNCASAYPVC